MKALKSLLTNRYSICIIVVCVLQVLLNQNQVQRIQRWHSGFKIVDLKWHSVDLKLLQSYFDNNVSNHSII